MARNHEIRVRLNPDEREKIELKAKDAGLEPSTYLRTLGLLINFELELKPQTHELPQKRNKTSYKI